MGRIARALVTGYGYADPFTGHSGPTAWVPPLYPLLLAGVFKIFGVYTAASAWVILTINSIFSAATALLIYEIAARCFQKTGRARKIALWSAWLWALYPAALQYAVHWVWDMALTAFLFSAVIVLALRACILLARNLKLFGWCPTSSALGRCGLTEPACPKLNGRLNAPS